MGEASQKPVQESETVQSVQEPKAEKTTEPKRARTRAVKDSTPSERPAFKATVTSVHSHATRKIATGQFESLEIHVAADAKPDNNYTLGENLARMAAVTGRTADDVAEDIRRRIELGKGDR